MKKIRNENGITILKLLLMIVAIIVVIVFIITKVGKKENKKEEIADEITKYVDANGQEAFIPKGFKVLEEELIDNGLVVVDEKGNEFVWVPVLNADEMIQRNSDGNYSGILHLTEENKRSYQQIELHEPAIVNVGNKGEKNAKDGATKNLQTIGFDKKSTAEDFKKQMQQDFNDMAESVKKYKGFYVGRYETSGWDTVVTSQKGQEGLVGESWYIMYAKQRELYSKNTDSVRSGMIWGCQYDQILAWIEKKGYDISNSTKWGNHKNSVGDASIGAGRKAKTGSNEAWKACNIYDLAGNFFEHTMEASGIGARVCRGGCYSEKGDANMSVSCRWSYSPEENGYGSRLQLYLK